MFTLVSLSARRSSTAHVSRLAASCAAIMGALACSAGCGSQAGPVPVYPVSGSIKVEGEPASGAFLVFHPQPPLKTDAEAIRPSAQVKEDGSFKLTSFDESDGAPAGSYAVTLQWNKLVKEGSDVKAGPNVVPADYSKADTTPLIVAIKPENNQLQPIEITKANTKAAKAPRR